MKVLPITPDGVKTCWTWSPKKVSANRELLNARRAEDGSWRIYRKDYLQDEEGAVASTLAKSLWDDKTFTNDYGRRALKELFGEAVLDFPKSPHLIERLLAIGAQTPDAIVVDFFAGSGTTAEAVVKHNRQDAGNRRFVLVQLPEPTHRKDYPTIAEITKERVRRVIKKVNDEDEGKLGLDRGTKQDRGFRVFKLAESNFKTWELQSPNDPSTLAKQLELHVEHIRDGRTNDHIVHELLLKSGFPLTTSIETLTLAGKQVYSAAGETFIICLEREITLDLIRAIADRKPERVVCLDAGFAGNDQLKANAVQTFKTKGITSFKTV